jgi:toxin ParE1/3/4
MEKLRSINLKKSCNKPVKSNAQPQYIIAPAAISDLDDITDYFAEHNIDAGERLLDEFRKKCRYLIQFPSMGRSYSEIRSYLRGLPMQNYIIFYRVINNDIEIMRVIKGDRDLEAIFEADA